MVLTCTIVLYIYQRVFKAHKLNDKKKLTGGPSPTVQCNLHLVTLNLVSLCDLVKVFAEN